MFFIEWIKKWFKSDPQETPVSHNARISELPSMKEASKTLTKKAPAKAPVKKPVAKKPAAKAPTKNWCSWRSISL